VFGATERKSYERELVALRRGEQEARARAETLYEQVRDVARVLQSRMLPGELPTDDRYELASYYESAVERLDVGGDWYDAFALDSERIAISIGDVVGRGLEAAATMGQLRSTVRALASAGLRPLSVLERTNVFFEQTGSAFGATAIYGQVDLRTGHMRFASAGHLPPVLVRPGGEALLLEGGRSVPLGAAFEGEARIEDELVLEPGSRVLLYTDGLVERRGHPLDEDLDSFVRAFGERAGIPLSRAVDELVAAAVVTEADDKCMLAFAYRP
jgi:serine/threonine-protein kinase RsbW